MTHKAHAKVNIFLKIVGTRGDYHEINSRFMLVKNLFDTLSFEPKQSDEPFELVGDFNCALSENTIYKMYLALQNSGYAKQVDEVMAKYALHVKKKIPTGAGLGGGSSDSATFLKMMNQEAKLELSLQKMLEIGSTVGADVAFFICGYHSANVSGIGEKVEEWDEKWLDIEVFTPDIACNTGLVYRTFRESFLQENMRDNVLKMSFMRSEEVLKQFPKEELNDLFLASLKAYPELSLHVKDGWFFSGSGSSFFRIKDEVS